MGAGEERREVQGEPSEAVHDDETTHHGEEVAEIGEEGLEDHGDGAVDLEDHGDGAVAAEGLAGHSCLEHCD